MRVSIAMVRSCFAWLVPALAMLALACGRTAPAQSAERTATAASNAAPAKVNIDAIFPPGRERELVLNNCTSCHTFVPIVILQMDKEQWARNAREHRVRVDGVSDDDFQALYAYLMAHFNPDTRVPKLPKELLDTWTSY